MKLEGFILNKYYMAMLHLMVWALLFILPFFYNFGEFKDINAVFVINWIPLIYFALLYFVNYLFLIDKFLFSQKTLSFTFLNLILIIVFILLINYTKNIFRNPEWNQITPDFQKWMNFRLAFSLIVSAIISITIKISQQLLKNEKIRNEKETQFLKTELDMLKFQVHPHFFFNALNNIYSLIDISQEKAKETVHGLGKLMRYLLYETSTENVSLLKEIEFTKNFVSLMKLRVSNKVKITENYPSQSEVSSIQIPPLLFISLIENAFKHGVSAENQSEILINMSLHNGELMFTVQNNNYPKAKEDKGGSGVGMENLRVRLMKLYPGKHDYFQHREGNTFTTSLKITL